MRELTLIEFQQVAGGDVVDRLMDIGTGIVTGGALVGGGMWLASRYLKPAASNTAGAELIASAITALGPVLSTTIQQCLDGQASLVLKESE